MYPEKDLKTPIVDGWVIDCSCFPASMGVYLIRCSANGLFYVGASINIRSRIRQHWYDLIHGKGSNSQMQEAWLKYGASTFSVEIIELVQERKDLLVREQYWIDRLNAIEKGFNLVRAFCKNEYGVDQLDEKAKDNPLIEAITRLVQSSCTAQH